jgi:hypothetical protein
MALFICTRCGCQFDESAAAPLSCPICKDERQYLGEGGQTWTTQESIARRFTNTFRQYESNLLGIGTVPRFAIGQRAMLIQTSEGNFLWDCISLLDEATINIIKALGGLTGIAISHPHYYSCMVDWSHTFGNVPIHLAAADRQWIMRSDKNVKLWEGDILKLTPEITLIRCGGHFAGATVLHWSAGADGRGVLLTGDVIKDGSDRKSVSFMRSYPNLIPLTAPAVARIRESIEPFAFDAIYGPFFEGGVPADGKEVVRRSADRYIAAILGDGSAELV